MEDLIRNASMKYTRGDSIVAFEKLLFLQKRHAARYASSLLTSPPTNPLHDLNHLAVEPIAAILDQRSAKENFPLWDKLPDQAAKKEYVKNILLVDAHIYQFPANFVDRNIPFFVAPSVIDLRSSIPNLKLHNVPVEALQPINTETFLSFLHPFHFVPESDWNTTTLASVTSSVIVQGQELTYRMMEKTGWKLDDDPNSFDVRLGEHPQLKMRGLLEKAWKKLVHGYLRWAVMGGRVGPDGSEGMRILGKEEVIRRLGRAEEVFLESLKETEGGKEMVR
jgi:glutamyl-tRNA synthetase